MAQYKVLQDIEAEDKLLGPLSLRQFIYAIIVIVLGAAAFQLIKVAWYFAIPFLPPMVFFGLLAAPFGQNQSSEVWMLAKIRFFVFPRIRIWNQSGIEELVHVTVPKKIEKYLSKGFSKDEVSSRLSALANTLDTRGWAIKNITPDVFKRATAFNSAQSADRLIDINSIPQNAQPNEMPGDDVFDAQSSPLARITNQNIQASAEQHRQQLLDNMQNQIAQTRTSAPLAPTAPQTTPTASTPNLPSLPNPVVVSPHPETPTSTPIQPQPILSSTGQPVHEMPQPTQQPIPLPQPAPMPEPMPITPYQPAPANMLQKPQAPMTSTAQTVKLNDVTNTDRSSMNVPHADNDDSPDEVVISLH
mgnify:CR=1 FL=1